MGLNSYQFHEVLDYLTYQIRKAHDVTRERFLLIFWYVFMKLSRFHETKYKQKRFLCRKKITQSKLQSFCLPFSSFFKFVSKFGYKNIRKFSIKQKYFGSYLVLFALRFIIFWFTLRYSCLNLLFSFANYINLSQSSQRTQSKFCKMFPLLILAVSLTGTGSIANWYW